MTSEKLNNRLAKLEGHMLPGALQVFAYGSGTHEELDALMAGAPGLKTDAIASVVWFPWGGPMRLEWGPAGRFWGAARRCWPAH